MKSGETLTHYNMKNLENTATNDEVSHKRTDSAVFCVCERVKNGKAGKQKPGCPFFQASLGVPGMFQAVGSSPHLLVDLDGFLVLLQLCSVGRHLQQTLVSRAESRTVQSKWQHWGDMPEATCFWQRCSDDRDELSFTTYEKPITDMKKSMYLLDSSPL